MKIQLNLTKLTDKPYVRMTKEILPMSFYQALCSDVTILLNLTNKNVYTRDHVGNVRVYPPVVIKEFSHYEGKVLFIQLKLYDHKDYVQEHTSIKDYMLSYIKKYKGRENPKRNFSRLFFFWDYYRSSCSYVVSHNSAS